MENPYNGNYYQPYTPTPQQTPVPPVYDGNQTMASLSLVMGILALLSLCCMPFLLFIFAGLAILFSCLSKGQYARSIWQKQAWPLVLAVLPLQPY